MPEPPQAVEASCNKDARGKTKNYYLIHNFATKVSISAQWQSQQ